MELFFLGCGGGRIVVDTQSLPTGGFRLHDGAFRMHADPGPGALLRTFSNRLSPQDLCAVFVSHAHLDHCGDAKVIIEAMTLRHWGRRYGSVIAAKSVISGDGDHERELPDYFQSLVETCKILRAGESHAFRHSSIVATKAAHEDASAIGFIYSSSDSKRVGYTGDTQDFAGLWKQYDGGIDCLVVNCLRHANDRLEYHLCMDEVIAGVESMEEKPKLVAFTHFGEKFLRVGMEKEVARFVKKTGVRAVAAREGLRLEI